MGFRRCLRPYRSGDRIDRRISARLERKALHLHQHKRLPLQVRFFKRAPNGVEVDRLDDVQFDDLVGQKPDRPTCMTFRRLRTSLCHQPSLRGARKRDAAIHLWNDLWRRLAGCQPAMDRFTAFAMTPNVQQPNSRAANVLSPIRHCEERASATRQSIFGPTCGGGWFGASPLWIASLRSQ